MAAIKGEVDEIRKVKYKLRKEVCYVFTFLCLIGLSYQSILALLVYFGYGTVVDVKTEAMTEAPIPAFTVCNNEKYAFSRLEKQRFLEIFVKSHKVNYVAVKDQLTLEEETNPGKPNLTLVNYLDLTKIRIVTIAELADFIPTIWEQHVLGYQVNELVTTCRVAIVDPDSQDGALKWENCTKVAPVVATIQKGNNNCFTFMKANPKENIDPKSVPTDKLEDFSRGVIAELDLDVRPEEYFDVRLNHGALFLVHSPYDQPLVKETALHLLVGTAYKIYVRRDRIIRLPPPYTTKCKYYRDPTKFKHPYPPRLDFNSQDSCLKSCNAYHKSMRCYCWPVDAPVPISAYPGFNSSLFTQDLGWCQQWAYPTLTMRALNGTIEEKYFFRYRNLTECRVPNMGNYTECHQFCRSDCQQEKYDVKYIRHGPWPSEEQIALSTTEEDRERLKNLSKSGIRIEIKYDSYQQRLLETKPQMAFIGLVCYIGGLIGLWLGFGFIDVKQLISKKIADEISRKFDAMGRSYSNMRKSFLAIRAKNKFKKALVKKTLAKKASEVKSTATNKNNKKLDKSVSKLRKKPGHSVRTLKEMPASYPGKCVPDPRRHLLKNASSGKIHDAESGSEAKVVKTQDYYRRVSSTSSYNGSMKGMADGAHPLASNLHPNQMPTCHE